MTQTVPYDAVQDAVDKGHALLATLPSGWPVALYLSSMLETMEGLLDAAAAQARMIEELEGR